MSETSLQSVLQEAFLTDCSKTQVLEKFVAGDVLDLKEKFLQQEDFTNMADSLNSLETRKDGNRSKSSRHEKNNNDSSSNKDGRKKRPFCYNCKSREHGTRECSEKKHVDQSKKKDTFDGALQDTKGKSGTQSQAPAWKDSAGGKTGFHKGDSRHHGYYLVELPTKEDIMTGLKELLNDTDLDVGQKAWLLELALEFKDVFCYKLPEPGSIKLPSHKIVLTDYTPIGGTLEQKGEDELYHVVAYSSKMLTSLQLN
ncbi:hypothetical protein QOT17_010742 [Balamuthia mandrillaris]